MISIFMMVSQKLNIGNFHYYHFVGLCGAFCELKWRVWLAKMYFILLKYCKLLKNENRIIV